MLLNTVTVVVVVYVCER